MPRGTAFFHTTGEKSGLGPLAAVASTVETGGLYALKVRWRRCLGGGALRDGTCN